MHRFLRHSTENCAHIGTHKTGSSPTWGSQKGRKLAEGRKQFWNDDKSEKIYNSIYLNFEGKYIDEESLQCTNRFLHSRAENNTAMASKTKWSWCVLNLVPPSNILCFCDRNFSFRVLPCNVPRSFCSLDTCGSHCSMNRCNRVCMHRAKVWKKKNFEIWNLAHTVLTVMTHHVIDGRSKGWLFCIFDFIFDRLHLRLFKQFRLS